MGVTIMIIDDEEQMRKLVQTFLLKEGYTVLQATDGIDALAKIKNNIPDLLIVDVMMPFIDGFTFASEVKKIHDIPLIFLSAKGEEWDKVHGLKLGADDYIVKPFHPGELLARIESVLRRAKVASLSSTRLILGPLVIDTNSHSVKLDDQSLSFTLKEYELLLLLAKNNGKLFSREQLLQSIWGDYYTGSERTVDTHIKTLRLKLKKHGALIQTVWGKGYKFEV
ncbi:DNA-binding response OmpR family regulator [Metabacillus crassostreae]|uniref:response regulator transcription factor n=1 Tax=Metabacillus crassostreae TaxID=929098 RepID=UPI00195F0B5E|nr:response regulator transcription factor [Metabacillus crassostreae]MBM7602848.1 DNA-binding response OmpR family regulator [Metabacillus crassostreae]